MPRILFGIVVAWVGLVAQVDRASADDGAPNPRAFATERGEDDPRPDAATYVVLPAPTDLEALLKRLARPDFVVLDWARFARLQAAAAPAPLLADGAAGPPIASVQLLGTVGETEANLRLVLGVPVATSAPAILPIRLDDVFIQSARCGKRDLAVEKRPDGGWNVTLPERSEGPVEVAFRARVLSRGFERRLSVRIPESADTSLELEWPASAREIRLGGRLLPSEPPTGEPPSVHCRAAVGPRVAADLTWTASARAEEEQIAVETEVAISVESGVVHWRSRHQVQVERGSVAQLELGLDPFFSDYEVEIDGIPTELSVGKAGMGVVRLPAAAAAPKTPAVPIVSTGLPAAVSMTVTVFRLALAT